MNKFQQTILQSYNIIVRDLTIRGSSKVMYNPQPTALKSYFTIVHGLTCHGSYDAMHKPQVANLKWDFTIVHDLYFRGSSAVVRTFQANASRRILKSYVA